MQLNDALEILYTCLAGQTPILDNYAISPDEKEQITQLLGNTAAGATPDTQDLAKLRNELMKMAGVTNK